MGRKTFDDTEMEKCKLYDYKRLFLFFKKNLYIDNVLVSNKISGGIKNNKYFAVVTCMI